MERPVRLLVVDDDAPTRRLLSAALSSENVYEVVTAHGGAEALGIYQASPDYDLIISDLTMPEMSGIEFIGKLREQGCKAPILVLSSMQTDQSVARALESGADDYLQKPIDLRELRRAVRFLIDQFSQRKESTDLDAPEVLPAVPLVTNLANGTFVELSSLNDSMQAGRFQRFVDRLLAHQLNEKERNDLHLALEEIVQNAIEWGNHKDRSKMLRLSYCLMPDRITFRVEDEGAGFDPANLNDPSLNPLAHIESRKASGKRMGGWGIFLTRKVMDEVTYNRKGNVVFLTKYLRRGGLTTVLQNTAPPVPGAPSSSALLRATGAPGASAIPGGGALPASGGVHPAGGDASSASMPASQSSEIPSIVPSAAHPGSPANIKPIRRNTRLIRKTTRLLRKEDPRLREMGS